MAGTTLGTAYVQIVPTTQGISGSISNVLGGEAQSAGTSMGGKIGSFAKKAFIAAGVGMAVYKTIKAAINEGAKLQQSYIGGLGTLYGEAADAAREHAREAAAAGISMNTYAEQAVSFGAALKNAYGGDAKKAAETANMAILDMADNSAKMGTSIESIQMAYQGFAKQNYTMLDNLKLGYGGTKSEMERLLADAEKITGIHYDINNLGDVYEAIHVIQGEVGLTGVAAAEAATTFSGSFAAMKASAQNLLGSLALGENVAPAMESLMTAVSNFFYGNFLPMLGTIIKALPPAIVAFVKTGYPLLVQGIDNLMSFLAAALKAKADSLTGEKVASWLQTTLPKLLSAAGSMIKNFASALLRNMPAIVSAIGKIGLAIVKGLGSAIWGKVTAAANGIKNKFMAPINNLRDKVKTIINKVKSLFPFSIGKVMSNIKLPHFSISGKFGLMPPSVPKLSIKWYAKGGIVDGATLIGAGEAGTEAIVPLDPFWRKMERIAEAAEANQGAITINVYGTQGMDVNQLAAKVEQRLVAVQKQRLQAYGGI